MTGHEAYNRSVESGALERPQTQVPDSEKNQTVPAVKSAEFVSKVGPSGRPVGLGTFNPGVVGSNPTGPSRDTNSALSSRTDGSEGRFDSNCDSNPPAGQGFTPPYQLSTGTCDVGEAVPAPARREGDEHLVLNQGRLLVCPPCDEQPLGPGELPEVPTTLVTHWTTGTVV